MELERACELWPARVMANNDDDSTMKLSNKCANNKVARLKASLGFEFESAYSAQVQPIPAPDGAGRRSIDCCYLADGQGVFFHKLVRTLARYLSVSRRVKLWKKNKRIVA